MQPVGLLAGSKENQSIERVERPPPFEPVLSLEGTGLRGCN